MILLFKGFVLGFIFAVTMVAGTVWCAQVTIRHGWRSGLGVAFGITVGQAMWIIFAVAIMITYTMLPMHRASLPVLRVLAALVFIYMSVKMFRARKAESLDCPAKEGGFRRMFSGTLAISLGMPMRLLGYLAFGVASGLGYHNFTPSTAGYVAVGAIIGTAMWWCYIVGLGVLFGHKVSERVTLKSMNKLNRLSGMLYLLVTVMTLAPLLVKN